MAASLKWWVYLRYRKQAQQIGLHPFWLTIAQLAEHLTVVYSTDIRVSLVRFRVVRSASSLEGDIFYILLLKAVSSLEPNLSHIFWRPFLFVLLGTSDSLELAGALY